jgi:hypothetical protein
MIYNAEASLCPRLYNAHGELAVRAEWQTRREDMNGWAYRVFKQWQQPYGYLSTDLREHCLMAYVMQAMGIYQTANTIIRYEHEPTCTYNYGRVLKSVAQAYGVEPDEALHCWPVVLRQLALLGYCKESDIPGAVRHPTQTNFSF